MIFFLYDLFRFSFFCIFVGIHTALMVGLFLEWRRDRRSGAVQSGGSQDAPPLVSVIVPVRNEERRLERLLRSLVRQDYPSAEYIFIDDRSSDATSDLLKKFIPAQLPGKVIPISENPGPNHKQYALGKGIDEAAGTFLLFTDADCETPPGWISAMVSRMSDPRIGATIGPVFKKPGGEGFFHLYQCFDHAVRYMYLAGSTGLGAAGGGFGNNLILRRETLDVIGGYGSVPDSPTEDAALVARIRSSSHYRIRSALGEETFVITIGESTWKNLLNQTLRWNNGGLFSPDPATRFNFGFLMITISMGIIAIPVIPFISSLWTLSAAVLLAMTMNTIAVLKLFGSALPQKGLLAYLFQLAFTPVYFTGLTILGFLGIPVHWKGSGVTAKTEKKEKIL
ncbi:MAG: glycosyltransferase [Spirochaetaceae bacterium]|nr:glycosyltransferase [Spirochaetaceae bacterium]